MRVSSKALGSAERFSLFLALALVVCVAVFSYRSWDAFGRRSDQLTITQEVVASTNALLSDLKDAETGQRGYLLTGRDRYLEPYRRAITNIPETLTRLNLATLTRPDQAQRLEILKPLVQAKLDELRETLDLRRTGGPQAALDMVLTDRGKTTMDQIRMVCAEIQTVANRRLSQQSEASRSSANQIGFISTLGSLALFVLLVLSTITIQRGTHRRQRLFETLEASEEQIRQTRDWLQTTLQSIGDAVIATDEKGRITFLNGVAQNLTGWSQPEAAGRPLEDIFVVTNEDTGAAVENPVTKALRESRVVGLANHTRLTSKDGVQRPIDDSAAPIRDSAGKVLGVVLVFRDITERKRAAMQLRESETRFRQLADSMPQMVWTARPDGHVDYFNERWYEFTGFDRGKAGDESWVPVLHPQDVEGCQETWYRSVESGEPYEIEYRFWDRRNQRWCWHLGRALAARDSQNRIVRWFGTCTDIDSQKKVQEELNRANGDLMQFAFAASHDLQEPLRMISNYAQLLIRKYDTSSNDEVTTCIGYITEGTRRMRDLLADLLSYTEAGIRQDRPNESVDLNVVLEKVKKDLKVAIEDSTAQVLAPRLPVVHGPEAHYLQLFQNLIGNAIKYRGEAPPCVTISVDRSDSEWRFAVADNGIGIDPQYHKQIFGVFKRLHGKQIPGTGIGLAICQRVVERNGGRIWVESRAGHGATFRFTLPDEKGAVKPQAAAESESSSENAS
jgi:PAS domain S-box-containing protein